MSGARAHSLALWNHIHAEGAEELSLQDLANVINEASLESMEEYRLELRIARLLAKLNPSKACGPDEVPNWPLREYSELLAYPVCSIINASLQEQCLPTTWKYADVSHYPRKRGHM